jgi:hypothetical protein
LCRFVSVTAARWWLALWSAHFELQMRRKILYPCAGWHLQAFTLNSVFYMTGVCVSSSLCTANSLSLCGLAFASFHSKLSFLPLDAPHLSAARWCLALWSAHFELQMRRKILYLCAGWHFDSWAWCGKHGWVGNEPFILEHCLDNIFNWER